MGTVVDPFTRRSNPLAGGDAGLMSDGGHQIAMTTCLDANDAEAVLGVVIGDALDEAGEDFVGSGFRLRIQPDVHGVPSLTTVKVPDGVNSAAVRAYLLENFSMEIGSGVGEFADTVWRIGMMGPNANSASVTLVLGALKEAIVKA